MKRKYVMIYAASLLVSVLAHAFCERMGGRQIYDRSG